MSDQSDLALQTRESTGTSNARALRRENKVPAIIYGAGKDSIKVSIDHNKLMHATENEAFFSQILTLDVAGKKEKVVLKALQRDAYRPRILHADFFRISAKEKLTMTVPLHFLGEEDAPGVKQGGVIARLFNELEISCLPADLPEFIDVDITALEMDASIHMTEVKLPKGVEIVALTYGEEHDQAVVSIHKPKVVAEEPTEEEAAAAEAAAAEGDDEAKEGDSEQKSEDKNKGGAKE